MPLHHALISNAKNPRLSFMKETGFSPVALVESELSGSDDLLAGIAPGGGTLDGGSRRTAMVCPVHDSATPRTTEHFLRAGIDEMPQPMHLSASITG